MSAVISLIATAVVARVVIPAGAFVVSKCLEGLANGLSTEGKIAFDNAARLNPISAMNALSSVSQIRADFKPISSKTLKTSNIEEIKGGILAEIARQPFLVTDSAKLEQGVSALTQAKTFSEIEEAKQTLVNSIEDGHQQIFSDALLKSCQKASQKIGFTKIESLPSPLSSAVMRFAATDLQGRTIVTEINAPKNRAVKVETEVVGVSDGSCQEILDAFHNALEAEGVKSQPPKRKFTGGVCELPAVKDFLAKKLTFPPTAQTNKSVSNNDIQRSRKLNAAKNLQKQK